MSSRMIVFGAIVTAAAFSAGGLRATAQPLIDFADGTNNVQIGSFYEGVTFLNATWLNFENPNLPDGLDGWFVWAERPVKVRAKPQQNDPIVLLFDPPVSSISIDAIGSFKEGVQMDAFADSSGSGSPFASDLFFDDICETPWKSITLAIEACGIARVELFVLPTDCPSGAIFDNLRFAGEPPPVVTCPADVVIGCDESTDPSNTGTATATGASPTIASSDTVLLGPGVFEKTIIRTWTATDACGQSDTCDQIISIGVTIDIKPGDDECVKNDGHGVIPVAILGSAGFDVTDIDAGSVDLEGLMVKMVGKRDKLLAHYEDVNGDGFEDLVVLIEDVDGVLAPGEGIATLTGVLLDGTCISGRDFICVVP